MCNVDLKERKELLNCWVPLQSKILYSISVSSPTGKILYSKILSIKRLWHPCMFKNPYDALISSKCILKSIKIQQTTFHMSERDQKMESKSEERSKNTQCCLLLSITRQTDLPVLKTIDHFIDQSVVQLLFVLSILDEFLIRSHLKIRVNIHLPEVNHTLAIWRVIPGYNIWTVVHGLLPRDTPLPLQCPTCVHCGLHGHHLDSIKVTRNIYSTTFSCPIICAMLFGTNLEMIMWEVWMFAFFTCSVPIHDVQTSINGWDLHFCHLWLLVYDPFTLMDA